MVPIADARMREISMIDVCMCVCARKGTHACQTETDRQADKRASSRTASDKH